MPLAGQEVPLSTYRNLQRREDTVFSPAPTYHSHHTQTALQRLLNDGWKVCHAYPSTYLADNEYDPRNATVTLNCTILVLSRDVPAPFRRDVRC